MMMTAVAVAIVLVGLPLAVSGLYVVRDNEMASLDIRASTLGRSVERRLIDERPIDERMLEPWVAERTSMPEARIVVGLPDGSRVSAGSDRGEDPLRTTSTTSSGAVITMELSRTVLWWRQGVVIALVSASSLLALGVGIYLALRFSRRLSAPLIYLAASAEQVGSGQVRPRMAPTGIEEIDLVLAELVRTSDRMAGRLAAERQFGADASHQLRTPLTALMMRLEEIEMLSDNEEVRGEAHAALDQVERMVGVVDDLLATSRQSGGGTTEAVHLDDIFTKLEEEFARTFETADRPLQIVDPGDLLVLATPGSLAQVLATILENSLKYGAGTTRVVARKASNDKGVFIDISDEGEGVSDEIAPDIFTKHVSGGGSSGLGLAIAKELITADGGRLELSQRRPAVFSVYLAAVPSKLDPEKVLPAGGLVTVGRRHRRR